MNKAESKYFNTALLMNQALIELLDKKEFEYITIKEVCSKAGVNRSTFYLHYENMNDLLEECAENKVNEFFSYFSELQIDAKTTELDNLILISHEYLLPYLQFFQDNKKILNLFFKYGKMLNSYKYFNIINKTILNDVFRRFSIDQKKQDYMLIYYYSGIIAIVSKWLANDCKDDMEYIADIIIDCVRPIINKE